MCLITLSKDGAHPNWDGLKRAAVTNRDGYGVMFHDGEKVQVFRTMHYQPAEAVFRSLVEEGVTVAMHFRWATHGRPSPEYCHPFEIHPGDYLMHNGIISTLPKAWYDKHVNDSKAFAAWLSKRKPTWYECNGTMPVVNYHVAGSRVLVMRQNGELFILNDDLGIWHEGVWYSNGMALRPAKTGGIMDPFGGSGRGKKKHRRGKHQPTKTAGEIRREREGGVERWSLEEQEDWMALRHAIEDRYTSEPDAFEYESEGFVERNGVLVPADSVVNPKPTNEFEKTFGFGDGKGSPTTAALVGSAKPIKKKKVSTQAPEPSAPEQGKLPFRLITPEEHRKRCLRQ